LIDKHYIQGGEIKKNTNISIFFFSFTRVGHTIGYIVEESAIFCLKIAQRTPFDSPIYKFNW